MPRRFEVLFERGEKSAVQHQAFEPYGELGFPNPPKERPWIYSNFVQSLDGIVSLLGRHFAGSDISQSAEDRWLMDLLRAHADAVLTGSSTLIEERNARDPKGPGIVFRVADPQLRELRDALGRGPERNIIVTGRGMLPWSELKLFTGDDVESGIVTTEDGARNLGTLPAHILLVAAGKGSAVEWHEAMRQLRQQWGIRYLLCEGGPTLYGSLARADLIDEKFVTVSPVETGQVVPYQQERLARQSGPVSLRPTTFGGPGFTMENMTWWDWISSRRVENHEFNRYRRRRT